jgi:hypothetical protein
MEELPSSDLEMVPAEPAEPAAEVVAEDDFSSLTPPDPVAPALPPAPEERPASAADLRSVTLPMTAVAPEGLRGMTAPMPTVAPEGSRGMTAPMPTVVPDEPRVAPPPEPAEVRAPPVAAARPPMRPTMRDFPTVQPAPEPDLEEPTRDFPTARRPPEPDLEERVTTVFAAVLSPIDPTPADPMPISVADFATMTVPEMPVYVPPLDEAAPAPEPVGRPIVAEGLIVDEQPLAAPELAAAGGDAVEGAAGELRLDRLGLDLLPGLEAELGLSAVAAQTEGADGPAAPAVHTALGELIPPFDAQLAARAFTSHAETPDLDDAAPALTRIADSGSFDEESLPGLLARLHREGFTGRLALPHGEAEKAIYFDAGFPVHATSTLPHDRLSELIWREGRMDREQHARTRAAVERGRSPAEALLECGALRRDELFAVQRHHAEEIVYSCFVLERGSWSLGRESAARTERLSLPHPHALIAEGIRRKYTLERLVREVGPLATVLVPTAALARTVAEAALSPAEQEAADRLARGPAALAQLVADGPLDELAAYALAATLLALGAAVVATAAGAGAARSRPGDRERALAKHAQVREADYFAILGVARTATAYEIRRAWERLRNDFAPVRFAPAVGDALDLELAEIRDVLDEAYRVLADDRLREAYRSNLPQTA